MVLTLSSAAAYPSSVHPTSIYQHHHREDTLHQVVSSLESGVSTASNRNALLNRMGISEEENAAAATAAEAYAHAMAQSAAMHNHHSGAGEPSSEHSPVATKNAPVAHSQYSHHSLAHNAYDSFYTSPANSTANSPLVAISSTGQIINGHATPTVVQYAAPQHHVS